MAGANVIPKKAKDEVTVRGCVGRFGTDYILIQPDEGNSYGLAESRKVKLRPYLGEEVELTGVKLPSLSNSSHNSFGRLAPLPSPCLRSRLSRSGVPHTDVD